MLQVYLFGQFRLQTDGHPESLKPARAQELLSFLLLHPSRSHARERLAGVLWDDPEHGRAYLRKALWQLHTALARCRQPCPGLLVADEQSVRLAPAACWSDVQAFEAAYEACRSVPGPQLAAGQARALEAAVELYAADLLESCYHEWCTVERARLQHRYLSMLGQLMDFCEETGSYEQGIDYAMRVLRVDAARESAHRQLMRLFYLGGHRTEALRQYRRCTAVLRDELAAHPSPQTTRLHELIRADAPLARLPGTPASNGAPPVDAAARTHLRRQLADLQQQLRRTSRTIASLLGDPGRPGAA